MLVSGIQLSDSVIYIHIYTHTHIYAYIYIYIYTHITESLSCIYAGDPGWIPGSGRSPGGGPGQPSTPA